MCFKILIASHWFILFNVSIRWTSSIIRMTDTPENILSQKEREKLICVGHSRKVTMAFLWGGSAKCNHQLAAGLAKMKRRLLSSTCTMAPGMARLALVSRPAIRWSRWEVAGWPPPPPGLQLQLHQASIGRVQASQSSSWSPAFVAAALFLALG